MQSHLRSVAVSSPTHPAGSEELTDGQLLRLATGLPVRLSLKPVQILQEQELGSVRLEPVPARSVLEQPVPGLEPVLLEPVRSVLELERGQPVPERQERALGLELVPLVSARPVLEQPVLEQQVPGLEPVRGLKREQPVPEGRLVLRLAPLVVLVRC